MIKFDKKYLLIHWQINYTAVHVGLYAGSDAIYTTNQEDTR